MDHLQNQTTWEAPKWEKLYREGTPPWDSGVPSRELVRVLSEGHVRRGPVLEFGCGTGADAVYLAQQGFDVTAVDVAPTAIERARNRVELAGATLRLVLDDIFQFTKTSGPCDFVYDAGFYHFMRRVDLDRHLDMLWRVMQPGSLYFVLAGSDRETADDGPPQVSEDEIRGELGRLFEFVHLRPFRFESPRRAEGYQGWSCLARRPSSNG